MAWGLDINVQIKWLVEDHYILGIAQTKYVTMMMLDVHLE